MLRDLITKAMHYKNSNDSMKHCKVTITHYESNPTTNFYWVLDSILECLRASGMTFRKNVDDLSISVESNLPSSTPFPILGLIDDPEIQKKCAYTYINCKYPAKNKVYSIIHKLINLNGEL
jgi:hypothetical protein